MLGGVDGVGISGISLVALEAAARGGVGTSAETADGRMVGTGVGSRWSVDAPLWTAPGGATSPHQSARTGRGLLSAQDMHPERHVGQDIVSLADRVHSRHPLAAARRSG